MGNTSSTEDAWVRRTIKDKKKIEGEPQVPESVTTDDRDDDDDRKTDGEALFAPSPEVIGRSTARGSVSTSMPCAEPEEVAEKGIVIKLEEEPQIQIQMLPADSDTVASATGTGSATVKPRRRFPFISGYSHSKSALPPPGGDLDGHLRAISVIDLISWYSRSLSRRASGT